ncbi:hypothetical protein G3M48_001315 [Beauveria asiatica]|uniref:Uncharacterized protein n=1 Tax=Beauveria asiatica TaxID=1069075 RepID=A0AAW0RZL7_9HYPO
MVVPGWPLQGDDEVGSKRKLNTSDNTPTKRGRNGPLDRKDARPIMSGEHLWSPSYTKYPLYCSEADKTIFGIHFSCLDPASDHEGSQWRLNKPSLDEKGSLYQSTRLNSVEDLMYRYQDAGRKAMATLLGSYGLRQRGRGRKLELRYGGSTSLVDTDGIFERKGLVVAYAEFANMASRRIDHAMALLPETKRKEEREITQRRGEEHARIKPAKEEEDAQIALMMAAMVQEMLRSGERNQLGAWARVIGIGANRIFMYQGWVPRRFVETFRNDQGFVVEYRSVLLKNRRRIIRQLDCFLRERSPLGDQPGPADAAKC